MASGPLVAIDVPVKTAHGMLMSVNGRLTRAPGHGNKSEKKEEKIASGNYAGKSDAGEGIITRIPSTAVVLHSS